MLFLVAGHAKELLSGRMRRLVKEMVPELFSVASEKRGCSGSESLTSP
jgi:hypothetical protein